MTCALPSLQISLLILHHCACPRIQFLLRTAPTSKTSEATCLHDYNVRAALVTLVGEDLGVSQWRQASHRLSMGGLGLGSARRDRSAAYLGAMASNACHLSG